jgi:hypothetical protein
MKKAKVKPAGAPALDPHRVVVTATQWAVHRAGESPMDGESIFVDVIDHGGERGIRIGAEESSIDMTEDEFEMVVQAGAQAFLQRWPR